MIDELKPCPFCGSRNIREHSGYPLQYWSVKCGDCGGSIRMSGSRHQVISAWNRRPASEG